MPSLFLYTLKCIISIIVFMIIVFMIKKLSEIICTTSGVFLGT